VLLVAIAAQAAPGAGTGTAREEDLAALRARIQSLKTELEARQSDAREARDALRTSETAISDANRALVGFEARARAARAAIAELGQKRDVQARALEANEATLGRLLAARAAAGASGAAPDVVRLVLSGEDFSDAARQLYYLTYVSRAATQVIDMQRAGIAELARLRADSEEKANELAALEASARADRERLLKERRERRRVLDRLSGEIRGAKKRMQAMVADEARLARLIEEIAKVLAARPGAGYARVERVPEAGLPSGSFASLRGKLRLPVRGEVVARFGAPRGDGGTAAKGMFIRAAEGETVRAIGPGRVVYADWMRGFGNILIVDHGDAYLSVYGNNESLLKQTGDSVASGEALATVGASGGNEETGLYFELRHLGRPFDPLGWVTLK
jgi:septal ring factor EnvC (AmiA/AmiB activator)